MERRLAAIFAADVVGYSRLIRADEEGALATFRALRVDLLIDGLRKAHRPE
jgi:adenylate cyclase